MRTALFASFVMALCACVAREQPRLSAEQLRFENQWASARPWAEATNEWSGHIERAEALPHTTALFWPEHQGKPGLELGELTGVADLGQWRERKVTGTTFSAEFTVDETLGRFGGLGLPESSYAWETPIGAELGAGEMLVLDGPWIQLIGTAPLPWVRARVVFRLRREPTPTSLYRHGTEILVASWGAALEPQAIELTAEDGTRICLFVNEHGPG